MFEPEPRISVAVAGVVVDGEGRVLLVKHSEAKRGGFWYGKWIPPGGRLELGESLAEGVVREKEQTNLDVRVLRDPFVLDRIVREGSRTRLLVVCINFVAEGATGELSAGSDAGTARWFSRRDLLDERGELHEDTWRLLGKSGILGPSGKFDGGSVEEKVATPQDGQASFSPWTRFETRASQPNVSQGSRSKR